MNVVVATADDRFLPSHGFRLKTFVIQTQDSVDLEADDASPASGGDDSPISGEWRYGAGETRFSEPEIRIAGNRLDRVSFSVESSRDTLHGLKDISMSPFVILRAHLLLVSNLCLIFLSFGICVSFLGPALPELSCLLGVELHTLSWVFFTQALSMLLSLLAVSLYIDHYGMMSTLCFASSVLSLTMFGFLLCSHLFPVLILIGCQGLAMGIIDAATNIAILRLLGRDVAPFMHALHFFYGLGAFLSPLIVKPFLEDDCPPEAALRRAAALALTNVTRVAWPGGAEKEETPDDHLQLFDRKISTAFVVLGVFQGLVALFTFFVSRICESSSDVEAAPPSKSTIIDSAADYGATVVSAAPTPTVEAPPARPTVSSVKSGTTIAAWGGATPETKPGVDLSGVKSFVALAALFAVLLFLYDGIQAGFGGYVYSYVLWRDGETPATTAEAARLTALFWGAFMVGRLVGIPVSAHFSPAAMLGFDVAGTLASTACLVIPGAGDALLVTGVVCFGFFLASVYPSALTLCDRCVAVSGGQEREEMREEEAPVNTPAWMTSTIVFGAAVGEMLVPVFVGHAFVDDDIGPDAVLWIAFSCSTAGVAIFLLIWFFFVSDFVRKSLYDKRCVNSEGVGSAESSGAKGAATDAATGAATVAAGPPRCGTDYGYNQ